jgi:hypothetical protein
MPYTIPPDTRAVGTGNPPVDMDDVADVLTGMQAGYNILNTAFASGADPTGAADSTAAINAALSAGAGRVVIIPPGTFTISAPLVITAGTTLQGFGNGTSVIQLKASTAVTSMLTVSNVGFNYSVTISDLQLNGNKANSATATHGIYLFAGSDCIVQRVRVVNVSGNAITLDGSGTYLGTAVKVLNSFVRSCGGDGLHITQYATDTLIAGCDFGSCTGNAYYLAGIQVALVGSIGWGSLEGLVCDTGSGEVWVSGCRFDQNLYYGVWVLCPNFTMGSSLVYDNSAIGTGTEPGILIDAGASDTVISGCRSVGGLNGGSQQSYGITLNSGRTGPAIITGNDFQGNGTGSVNYAGSASGDQLSGNLGYNAPLNIDGVTVSGTPAAGDVLLATSSSAATWDVLPSGTVTVSPYGIANGKASITNNGANYGPDTASTVTSGIQEAVSYAITEALAGHTYEVVLLPGIFTTSTFTNTTYRSVITVDPGYALTAGAPITISIRGTVPSTNLLNGTTTGPSHPLGGAIIDASGLDVLAQGLFKQGRIFLVPPYGSQTPWPIAAVQLAISNMTIIVPAYNANGTGPSHAMGSGYGTMGLFINGDTQASNANHFLFVNGIDAWAASSCEISGVSVISAIAAYNSDGNVYAGSGGVLPMGSAAGFVFPANDNEGNVVGHRISTLDVPIGVYNASHLMCDQFYAQYANAAIYDREGGHGALYQRINVQQSNIVVQHALLTQLTNSVGGHVAWDPVGDLYAPIGQSFPSSASASSLIINQASLENNNSVLADDSSNPLTLVVGVEVSTAGYAASKMGSGKNLMVNMIDITGIAQTVLTGTSAGTVTYTQSGNTPWDKRFVAYLAGYENTTGTAQTITFVIAYNNAPAIIKDSTGGASVSTTTLTLPASMGAPVTGYIVLAGY